MLSIKERQTILKTINLYNGIIDGIEGVKTKRGYKLLQQKYFTKSKDIDGIYGNNTDILLKNVNTFLNSKYFKLEEFKCKCNYCTGYPHLIDKNLVTNLNLLRSLYGPLFVSSGLRCTKHNKEVNGTNNSKHLIGKAADISSSNINKTLISRKNSILKWLTFNNSDMAYCNGFMKYKDGQATFYRSSTMQNAIHFQVK